MNDGNAKVYKINEMIRDLMQEIESLDEDILLGKIRVCGAWMDDNSKRLLLGRLMFDPREIKIRKGKIDFSKVELC